MQGDGDYIYCLVMLLSDYCRDFILKLCTDFQLGVCYKSKGSLSSWRRCVQALDVITYNISFACCRSNNPTLLQLLLSLKDANEDNSHHQQIVLATLKACPDLVISYLNGVSYTFEPKLSSKWILNVEFILQVLLCVHLYVQMCVLYVHMFVSICVTVCVHVCITVCVHVCGCYVY